MVSNESPYYCVQLLFYMCLKKLKTKVIEQKYEQNLAFFKT